MDVSYPFILHTRSRGNRTVYRAEINVNAYPMERAFWDVVAVVDSGSGETYDAILGGLSIFLKDPLCNR